MRLREAPLLPEAVARLYGKLFESHTGGIPRRLVVCGKAESGEIDGMGRVRRLEMDRRGKVIIGCLHLPGGGHGPGVELMIRRIFAPRRGHIVQRLARNAGLAQPERHRGPCHIIVERGGRPVARLAPATQAPPGDAGRR